MESETMAFFCTVLFCFFCPRISASQSDKLFVFNQVAFARSEWAACSADVFQFSTLRSHVVHDFPCVELSLMSYPSSVLTAMTQSFSLVWIYYPEIEEILPK